jgi:beta-galactosidase
VNGVHVGDHAGAYTTFTLDVTDQVAFGGADNVIAVRVDSSWHGDLPPEGGAVDYYVWGGIVRDVSMILTDPVHLDSVFVTTPELGASGATVHTRASVRNDGDAARAVLVTTNVYDASGVRVATGSQSASVAVHASVDVDLDASAIAAPHLWHPDDPYLYTTRTEVSVGGETVDDVAVRVGLRQIDFSKSDGKFRINGEWLKLRGLDRHEQYPYVGRAAPNRLQARDADILKYELGVNIVRTSHYPQDPEFLDRADEIGLLVLEELPGWHHIGDAAWTDHAVENVREMITRDRNHPSIITWGVRINESGDDHDFYTRTNTLARQLDPTRPTSGIRNFRTSEWLEDVYTYNDFSGGAEDPAVLPWLITESVGHTRPDRAWDPEATLITTMLTHLNVQNQAAAKQNIAGALDWCAFDYNTTFDTDSCHDAVCYHGVSDIYRLPKFAASVFASQRDPARYGPYVSIDHYWMPTSSSTVYVAGNCDEVELFANGVSKGRIAANSFTSLPHPFFHFDGVAFAPGMLEARCFIGGVQVATATRKTPGAATQLVLRADDATLVADGGDMTRVVVQALDASGTVVPYDDHQVSFAVSGPGAVIGESPLALEAGGGAVYLKSSLATTGTITLTASSPGLASASTSVTVKPSTATIVPPGTGSYRFGFVHDVNDAPTASGRDHFDYTGTGWSHGHDDVGGLFGRDNSWCHDASCAATLAFHGTRVVLYGVLAPNHGAGVVSVDGGPEAPLDFHAAARRGNVALWASPVLPDGDHVLKVRATGNGEVVLDGAVVVSGGASMILPSGSARAAAPVRPAKTRR